MVLNQSTYKMKKEEKKNRDVKLLTTNRTTCHGAYITF
jgi:hypothetical protein